jgi:lipid A disaccharide synthetase
VIGWRAGRFTEALARRLVRSECAGSPNIVLGERVFPELLGPAFTAEALADEACRLLDAKAEWVENCRRVVLDWKSRSNARTLDRAAFRARGPA